MRPITGCAVLLAVGVVAGCEPSQRGMASLHGTQPVSKLSGTATLTPTTDGLRVVISVINAPPGLHGLHIHENGNCGNSGNDAGGHFNPDKVKHGFLPKDGFAGAHAGDLGNIEVHPDGTGTLSLTVSGLSLVDGPHAVAGRAIILHEKVDDFGQPTGNAGSRIGCGVITIKGSPVSTK